MVRIPDNPQKHPLASIYFQPVFEDKKSPDSLWNLGLSDLHLLRSEKVCLVTVLDDMELSSFINIFRWFKDFIFNNFYHCINSTGNHS